MASPAKRGVPANGAVLPAPKRRKRDRNLLLSLPPEVIPRIFAHVPRRITTELLRALPVLKAGLQQCDPSPLRAVDLHPFAELDHAAPAPPSGEALPSLARLLQVCASDLRALRLHAGLPARDTGTLVDAACAHCPALEELALADGGGLTEPLVKKAFGRLGHLRDLTVCDARPPLLHLLGSLPATCAKLSLVGTSIRSLQALLTGLHAFSSMISRQNSLHLTLRLSHRGHVLDQSGSDAEHDLASVALISAFLMHLLENGKTVCAGLCALTLPFCSKQAGYNSVRLSETWAMFRSAVKMRLERLRPALSVYTTLLFELSGHEFTAEELRSRWFLKDLQASMQLGGRLRSSHDGVICARKLLTSPLCEIGLNHLVERVRRVLLTEAPSPEVTGLLIEAPRHSRDDLRQDERAMLDTYLRRRCGNVQHVRIDSALEIIHDASAVKCLDEAMYALSKLQNVRAVSVCSTIGLLPEYGTGGEVLRLLDLCAGVRVVHLFKRGPRLAEPFGLRVAASLSRGVAWLLRAMTFQRVPLLECVHMEAMPMEAYDEPVSGEAGADDDLCRIMEEALRAVEQFEWERVNVDVSTVRFQIEAWIARARRGDTIMQDAE